jgi:2-hydroxychromene-2-carboxylate isomerase
MPAKNPATNEAPAPLEFYFDFTSPYSYLASEKIDALAARFGRKVKWRPILLGAIFKTTGAAPLISVPLKGDYSRRDFARSARFMGLPAMLPEKFPLATQAAARAYYWLHENDCALARRFAQSVFRAIFVDGRDASSPEVLLDLATRLGIDSVACAAAMNDEKYKQRLKDEVDRALAKGVFGGPMIFCDGEPFMGADRLPQLERWLETGGF